MKTINISFATKDDEYVLYMLVAMESVLLNVSNDVKLNFYILIPSEFSSQSAERISDIQNKYPNAQITFIDVKDKFKNLEQTHDYVDYPTYYRLLLPQLLEQNIEKCIYFDTDIIVNDDITEFYETDMGDNYFAGVRAGGYRFEKEFHKTRLNLPDVDNYVNTGVILLNIKKLRQDFMCEKFEKLIGNDYLDQDQDILNVACFNRIKILDLKYNVMTKYEKLWDKCIKYGAYTKEEIDNALKNPVIIHFADRKKPWNNKKILYSDIWWDYAKKTKYFDEIQKIYEKNKDKWYQKLFCVKKTPNKTIVRILFFKFTKNHKRYKKNFCKLLVVCHKPSIWIKSSIYQPIQTGRKEFIDEYGKNKISQRAYDEMLKNTIGDDSGENISNMGKYFCELTCFYWAWKNYEKLGNPYYIGFPHYRRFLMFENRSFKKLDNGCILRQKTVTKDFLNKISASDKIILKTLKDIDFVCAKPQDLKDTVYNHFVKHHKTQELDYATDLIKKNYPNIALYMTDYLNQNKGYYLNLFVMKKELFFELCEFLFDVSFNIYNNKTIEHNDRAYFTERLVGIYLNYLIKSDKYKYKCLPVALLQNTQGNDI